MRPRSIGPTGIPFGYHAVIDAFAWRWNKRDLPKSPPLPYRSDRSLDSLSIHLLMKQPEKPALSARFRYYYVLRLLPLHHFPFRSVLVDSDGSCVRVASEKARAKSPPVPFGTAG